jgi:hypothetical protein
MEPKEYPQENYNCHIDIIECPNLVIVFQYFGIQIIEFTFTETNDNHNNND